MTLIPTVKTVSEVRLMLIEEYETAFGIYNHDAPTDPESHPLAIIEMHSAEDTATPSLMYERMRQFAATDCAKYFNLSWPEFIDQPHDMVEEQLVIAAELKKRDDEASAKAIQELKQGKTP